MAVMPAGLSFWQKLWNKSIDFVASVIASTASAAIIALIDIGIWTWRWKRKRDLRLEEDKQRQQSLAQDVVKKEVNFGGVAKDMSQAVRSAELPPG